TSEAERLFPKVYGPVLRHLLDELAERLPGKKLAETARAVGHRLAAEHHLAVRAGKLSERVAQVVNLLGEWGGFCSSEGQNGSVILRCSDCPLAFVVSGHPEVCSILETMLADALGVSVRHQCRTEPPPQCYFEIGHLAQGEKQ